MNPEIVLGPPGCGKTHRLLSIVEDELAAKTPPHRIAYVSFTRRARREAVERACEKFGLTPADLPHFKTIHGMCYRWLGLKRDEVLEGKMVREFATWAGVDLNGRWSEDGELTGYAQGDRILHMEHLSRVRRTGLREMYDACDDNLPWQEVDRVVRHLNAFKAAHGVRDYTDMLTEFLAQGGDISLDVLLVDEAQDLSRLQWDVVARLAKGCRRVVVAGDDDQAIYGWAGADASTFVDMPGRAQVLGQSYRVPRAVQAVAQDVIGRVHHRRPKDWAAREEAGEVARAQALGDVDVSQGTVLVLARNTHVIADIVVPELRRRGVYYAWGDRPAVTPAVMDAIKAWEALRRGGAVDLPAALACYAYGSAGRMMAKGHRKLPRLAGREAVTIADLVTDGGLLTQDVWHQAMDRLPQDEVALVIAARQRGEKLLGDPRVHLSTIHGAKGGQADHVVLLCEMARRTWREYEEEPEAEARVWYVGVTRAKQKLTLVASRNNMEYPV